MGSDYLYRDITNFVKIGGVKVPVDSDGHYLDWEDVREDDGRKQARDLTSPYGSLQYAVGYGPDDEDEDTSDWDQGGDWMRCFDYAELPNGQIVLDATDNSDSGGYIEGAGYYIVSKEDAPAKAMELVDEALEVIGYNNREHDEAGWNQDPYYFVRAVARACGVEPYASASWDDLRRGPIPNF
jgi:hypothetical protein